MIQHQSPFRKLLYYDNSSWMFINRYLFDVNLSRHEFNLMINSRRWRDFSQQFKCALETFWGKIVLWIDWTRFDSVYVTWNNFQRPWHDWFCRNKIRTSWMWRIIRKNIGVSFDTSEILCEWISYLAHDSKSTCFFIFCTFATFYFVLFVPRHHYPFSLWLPR